VAQVFIPISGSNIGSHLAQIFVDIHTLSGNESKSVSSSSSAITAPIRNRIHARKTAKTRSNLFIFMLLLVAFLALLMRRITA
jgi:hypothetical protein